MKKLCSAVVVGVLLISIFSRSSATVCFAASKNDKPILLNEQSMEIGREGFSVDEYNDNGKIVYACSA